MNAIRELRYYEQHGANPEWDDFKFFKQTEEKLTADWKRFGHGRGLCVSGGDAARQPATALPPAAAGVQPDPVESRRSAGTT